MKLLKNCLAVILALMIAVITFFTWNLLFTILNNYESLSLVSLSSFPMVFFMIEIYVIIFAIFDYVVLKRKDAFLFKKYSLIVGGFSIAGIASSIFVGTAIYHSFIGNYVFTAYPLFMLIIHVLLLGISVYLAIISFMQISREKLQKTWEIHRFSWLRRLLVAFFLMYALQRLGGFLLLPLIFSSYDGVYVIPFYIQLLVPTFLLVVYLVNRFYKPNRKLNIILLGSALGYSILSLTYMILMAKLMPNAYPNLVNPLSVILQLERMIKYPVGIIVIYGFCIIYSSVMLVLSIVKKPKEIQQN